MQGIPGTRKCRIEVNTHVKKVSIDLTSRKEVFAVVIENLGSAVVYCGFNQNAVQGAADLDPGLSRPYGPGWPWFLTGNKINLDFAATGTKKVQVTLLIDAGTNSCDV